MPKNKLAKVLSITALEQMNTKQLIGYLSRLRECEESFENSDMEINLNEQNNDIIYFKNTQKWVNAYKLVRKILENKENIENWKRK